MKQLSQNKPTTLNISNLSFGYKKTLYKKINLEANNNELIAVIGKNGTGKSTLLKTISGIIPPIKGNISINNVSINSLTMRELSLMIGFSAITTINSTNLTVYDLIQLGRVQHTNIFGKLKNNDKIIINKAITQTGLDKLKNKKISEISDGERQRSFIAKLIAQQTKILIFDEPTAFLDIEAKHKITALFRKISKKNNKIIIFSTHDFNIALKNADKIWLFEQNKIINGTPEDLILLNKFDEIFSDKNLSFNNLTAEFDVNIKTENNVNIINKSSEIRLKWTKKALKKHGFETNNKSKTSIYILNKYWSIHENNKIIKTHSLDQLIKFLKNDKKN